MTSRSDSLPQDLAGAHAMILAERAARQALEAEAAEVKRLRLEIERLKLLIARLRQERFGTSCERSARLAQLELTLEDLEENAVEQEIRAPPEPTSSRRAVSRRKPARRPLPEHLPRTRIVYPGPSACPCCGGTTFRKLGEDITETLERVPARWQVVQHVRERVSCRCCETISQAPAPFHPISRGRAGPQLLAEVVHAKYGLHLPLHRQAERFAREGVRLEVSTLADWVGAVSVALEPLVTAIKAHVLAAERLHADDTPVPVLAKTKTRTGRLWTLLRDDRPFGGPDPPAALFFYSADRRGEHVQRVLEDHDGILQADAYSGFARLYAGGAMVEAGCWAHARRHFFKIAQLKKAPIAREAVRRIDALFAIEREITGLSATERLAVRIARSKPQVEALESWLKGERAKLSAKSETAKAIDYMLKRWGSFTRFVEDGRVCLTNNAAERALRGIAVGRKNWTFAGSDRGGERAAALYTLIETAKLNGVDALAWLADVVQRLPDHPASRLNELLPWAWNTQPRAEAG